MDNMLSSVLKNQNENFRNIDSPLISNLIYKSRQEKVSNIKIFSQLCEIANYGTNFKKKLGNTFFAFWI